MIMLGTLVSAHGADAWIQVRSKNFLLIGDAGEKEIRQTAARLEQFRETLRLLFPQIKHDGGIRTNVVVFKDAASYAPFKPKRPDGTVDNVVAGYFQAGEDVNFITLTAAEKSGVYGTIFHEYAHFLIDTNIGRSDVPPWLGEGLAEYLETLQLLDDQRVSLGAAPSGHLSLLRRSELIPLGEFFATDNAALHRRGDDSRTLFYAQAWAVTHYLLHASKPGGVRFEDIFSEVKNAKAPADLHSLYFGSDTPGIGKAIRDHINQPQIPTRIVQIKRTLPIETEATAAPLSDAQTSAYLGDLLFHTDRLAEAEVLLRKAVKADGDVSVANMSLGLVLAKKREFVEAKKHLEKAIAVDRTNHFAYFNYAYALSRESMDENGNISEFRGDTAAKMRDALQRAISLNPNFAESYRLLAFVSLVNGTDLDQAVDLLHKGLAVKPGDPHLRLMLAQVLLRQEKYLEAGTIAERLAAGAYDQEVWAEARSILHTVNQFRAVSNVKANSADVAKVFGPLPPLILKRSSLSDEEVARYDEDRQLMNLNILVDKPRFGERQIVGYVDRIACSDGTISYAVRSGDERFNLVSTGFGNIRLRVLTEGERSFTLDCGVSLSKSLTVLIYQPSAGARTRGRLLSMSFVPDFFRLKTPQEMANFRTVIIEDDRVLKRRPGGNSDRPTQPEN